MNIGDKVKKINGCYQATGTVVAIFKTTAGETRVVFEFNPPLVGMLHIFREDQLEKIEE